MRCESCDSAFEHADADDGCPSGGAFDGSLPVLGEAALGAAAAATQPCDCAFDHPAPGQKDAALCFIRAFDDLQGPAAMAFKRSLEFAADTAAIGAARGTVREWL